ncbi:MAG: archease [Promethearchaeota archaeon]|jgi:SHS2 domain-containing protein
MKGAGFKFKDHTADVMVRSWGRSLEEAFSQAALSLMATMSPNLEKISAIIEKKIEIESEDTYALCFDFLSEFLYLFDIDDLVFNEISVKSIKKIDDKYKLYAVAKGEKFDRSKHEVGTEVKAITYSFMNIEMKKNKIEIDIVFDI